MDIEQKKIEVKEDIARGPSNVIFARIAICDEVQLADLMKVELLLSFVELQILLIPILIHYQLYVINSHNNEHCCMEHIQIT